MTWHDIQERRATVAVLAGAGRGYSALVAWFRRSTLGASSARSRRFSQAMTSIESEGVQNG